MKKIIATLTLASFSVIAHPGHSAGPHLHANEGFSVNAISIATALIACGIFAVVLKRKKA